MFKHLTGKFILKNLIFRFQIKNAYTFDKTGNFKNRLFQYLR